MTKIHLPAILGGQPAFASLLPIIKPNVDQYSQQISATISKSLETNKLTAVNHYTAQFEQQTQELLGVPRTTAVASCTAGLILTMQALGLRDTEVILPSFTFSATAHAAHWNNCRIKLVDIDQATFTISPQAVREAIGPDTRAIIGVHMYGNPCDIIELESIAKEHNLILIFDAAHAIGSHYQEKPIGQFGDAEAFSLSPTKLITTGEGGIVASNNQELHDKLALDRNYGNRPNLECDRPGLNARMSEIHAAIGLPQIADLGLFVQNRNRYATLFKQHLADVPGLSFQTIKEGNVSAYKDFGLLVDKELFGLNRNQLAAALAAENIMTKFYFDPPIHRMQAYRHSFVDVSLPVTEYVSQNIICLPIYNHMDETVIATICQTIKNIHQHHKDIHAR